MTELRRSRQDDALCEMMSVGTGAALSAVSALLKYTRLRLGVAEAMAPTGLSQAALGTLRRLGHVSAVPLQGAASGTWGLALADHAASWVTGRLLHRALKTPWDALAQSALCEMANIAACAFWGAIARWAPGVYMPGVPEDYAGTLSDVLQNLAGAYSCPRFVLASFVAEVEDWDATAWLVLDQATLTRLSGRLLRSY